MIDLLLLLPLNQESLLASLNWMFSSPTNILLFRKQCDLHVNPLTLCYKPINQKDVHSNNLTQVRVKKAHGGDTEEQENDVNVLRGKECGQREQSNQEWTARYIFSLPTGSLKPHVFRGRGDF